MEVEDAILEGLKKLQEMGFKNTDYEPLEFTNK